MIISKTDLLEVKKDYLDKVMIRDGSEESKKAEQILNEACDAFIEDIIENFGESTTVEELIALTLCALALTLCALDGIEEELAHEFIKEIARKTIIGFSDEIFITFFRKKDGTC